MPIFNENDQNRKQQLSGKKPFLSPDLNWLYFVVALAASAFTAIFVIPGDGSFPLVYVRAVLALIFILWLPGFVILKALYLCGFSKQNSYRGIEKLENLVQTIGISLVVVMLVGMVLNFTPWGMRILPITISLLIIILCFSALALYRQKQLESQADTNANVVAK